MFTRFISLFLCLMAFVSSSHAGNVSFDVMKRRAELQQPQFSAAKSACLAANITLDDKFPEPVTGLHTTKDYGSDQRSAEFAWYAMVLGGRSLAGDGTSTADLQKLLVTWAKAGAFLQSDEAHDTYYALKRTMIPIIVNYSIIAYTMNTQEQQIVEKWIDAVVRRVDKKFDGDVDHNNHRYLADSALMAWGAFIEDRQLYEIGLEGFKKALRDANKDGSLDLETRRGARALWYMRHALASLTLIAETAATHKDDLYSMSVGDVSLETIMNYFLNAHYAPITIKPLSAQNYIPGPSREYLTPDYGYADTRGHGRHYMAFTEAYAHRAGFSAERTKLLIQNRLAEQRPLIDEYFGGNGSCFFMGADS